MTNILYIKKNIIFSNYREFKVFHTSTCLYVPMDDNTNNYLNENSTNNNFNFTNNNFNFTTYLEKKVSDFFYYLF